MSRSAFPQPEPPRQSIGATVIVMAVSILLLLAGAAMVLFPITMVLLIGMLPSVVAMIIDRSPTRSAAAGVSMMNLAGVFPFILDLWRQGQTFERAFGLMGDPHTWLLMYGSSGIGWLLFFAIPPLVAAFVASEAEGKIRRLQQNQQDLLLSWGPEVKTDLEARAQTTSAALPPR